MTKTRTTTMAMTMTITATYNVTGPTFWMQPEKEPTGSSKGDVSDWSGTPPIQRCCGGTHDDYAGDGVQDGFDEVVEHIMSVVVMVFRMTLMTLMRWWNTRWLWWRGWWLWWLWWLWWGGGESDKKHLAEWQLTEAGLSLSAHLVELIFNNIATIIINYHVIFINYHVILINYHVIIINYHRPHVMILIVTLQLQPHSPLSHLRPRGRPPGQSWWVDQ